MATTELGSAMIQALGERDKESRESTHLVLVKPLYSPTLSFLCMSLDGSRKVEFGQGKTKMRITAMKH